MTVQGQPRGDLSPYRRLADALAATPLTDSERWALKEFLALGDSAARVFAAAKAGRMVCADIYLAIHAVKGWDPTTGEAIDPLEKRYRGKIAWDAFAVTMASRTLACAERLGRRVSARQMAGFADVSPTVWHRAINRQSVCVENLFRICDFFSLHPNQLTSGPAGKSVFHGKLALEQSTTSAAIAAE